MTERAKKRSILRRIVRILVRLVGVVVLLAVVLVAFLHTPWGKSFVRGRVESRLNALVNGEVTVGELDYTFMFGSLEIRELEIRDASGKPAIRVGTLAVDLDRGSLLDGKPLIEELTIDGVDVQVVQTADGRSNLTGLFKPSDRKPLEQIRVAKLSVSGKATITKPDGTVITVEDLGLAGSVDARPAIKEVDLALAQLGAKVTIARAGQPPRKLAVALENITVARRPDAIDVEIGKIAAGALGIDSLGAHVKLADGKLRGAQAIKLGKTRVDSKQLADLLGRPVLLDDVVIDLAVSGPEDNLAIHGVVKTRDTSLAIDGTVDVSVRERPRYQLALVGKGKSLDVIASPEKQKKLPPVEGDVRIDIKGAGTNPLDLEADLVVAVGHTKIGKLALDSLNAKARAERGAYKLHELDARGLGFEIKASGDLAADKTLRANVAVSGSPAEATKVLAAAGITIPKKVPVLQKLDVTVTATGKLDGELAVELAPTNIAIAGGNISLAGTAILENKKLRDANAKVALRGVDIQSLARLAGRPPPKVSGSISGTVDLTRTGLAQSARYDVNVALREPAIRVAASGTADAGTAKTHAVIRRASDGAVIATLDGKLPLAGKGLAPNRSWDVRLAVAKRSIAELVALVPPRMLPDEKRAKIPAGDVELKVGFSGTPARPTGSISVVASVAAHPEGVQTVKLAVGIAPGARGLDARVIGDVALASAPGSLAKIDGTITTPMPFATGKLDVANMRAGATVNATIDLPERDLASLATVRAKLAEFGGKIDGRIAVTGPLKTPALDAKLRWHGYGTASGAPGETTLAASGSPTVFVANIKHGDVAIVLDVDRSDRDRIGVKAKFRAEETALLPLIPAFVAAKLPAKELGKLRWNMDGTFALVRGPEGNMALDQANVTGTLDLSGASFAIPNSTRKLHDIGLAIVAEQDRIRIKSLTAHESDVDKKDRRIEVSGLLALEKLKPSKLTLALSAHDWLLFGTPTFGAADAPRATADFDIGVAVDLTAPIMGVDATINSLALRSPDRLERGHQPEYASVTGDIIYMDASTVAGKLPYVPPEQPPAPKQRRPIDIRVHIPRPIRLEQTPFDVMATGEMTVTVRDEGVKTRGALKMGSGTLSLFGHSHQLVDGQLTFTDEHPKGRLELTFERRLPDIVLRELTRHDPASRVTFAGPPTKPKTTLGGTTNALFEVMAVYNAGRPVNVTRPNMPASNTVTIPRGDQLFILTFMAQNLPHLLFLDRTNAWADPYQGPASYGRITNFEGERYSDDAKRRVRAVARPNTPGRSSAELQLDRVLHSSDRAAVGVGLRAGDRVGGGVGLFFEWSSTE